MMDEKKEKTSALPVGADGDFPALTAADRVPDWSIAERERIAALDPVTDLKELSPPKRELPRIAELINELVEARVNARALAADVAEMRETWENKHAEELASLKFAKERLASADMALRLEALSLYDKHGGVPNAPGVGVHVRRVAKYDTDDAIDWAIKQDMRQFLAVNARLFAKHAIAVAGTAPLGFVTIARMPFATIAKNLSP